MSRSAFLSSALVALVGCAEEPAAVLHVVRVDVDQTLDVRVCPPGSDGTLGCVMHPGIFAAVGPDALTASIAIYVRDDTQVIDVLLDQPPERCDRLQIDVHDPVDATIALSADGTAAPTITGCGAACVVVGDCVNE
jgi:hypothetical protein